jgi:hypothetical protein
MDLVHAYETVVATRGRDRGEIEFGFLSVPRRMVAEDMVDLLDRPTDLISELDLTAEPMPISRMPGAIFALLAETDGNEALKLFMHGPDAVFRRAADEPELGRFAEYLAFAEVVPFEQSKPTQVALVTAAVGSATAVGAKGIPAIAAAAAAPPVAFFVLAGLAGGVLVINGIGLVAGLPAHPQTREPRARLRDRILNKLWRGK